MATLAKQAGSRAAELEWTQPIPAETARRLACDAAITPIVIGSESDQPRAERTTRVISGALRKALVVRDRGCRFPGCDRPPDWTDAHHIQHWADGGDTRMDNLLLLRAGAITAWSTKKAGGWVGVNSASWSRYRPNLRRSLAGR